MGADGHRECLQTTGRACEAGQSSREDYVLLATYVRWFALVLYCGVSAEGGEDVVGVWVYVGVLGVHVAFDYAV